MVSEVLRTGIQGCVRPLGIMTKSLGEPEISDGWVVQDPQVLAACCQVVKEGVSVVICTPGEAEVWNGLP